MGAGIPPRTGHRSTFYTWTVPLWVLDLGKKLEFRHETYFMLPNVLETFTGFSLFRREENIDLVKTQA